MRRGSTHPAAPTGRPVIGVAVLLLAVALLSSGGVIAGARAVTILEAGLGVSAAGSLDVRSEPDPPEWKDLWAGATAHWLLSAGLLGADSGSLELELRSAGDLVLDGGMTAEVTSCTAPFAAAAQLGGTPSCGGQATTVLPQQELAQITTAASGPHVALARLHAGSPRYFLVTLAIPAGTPHSRLEQRTARIGVGFFSAGAGGDREQPDPPGGDPEHPQPPGDDPELPRTGSDFVALGLLASGAVGLIGGVVLLRRGRVRHAAGPLDAAVSLETPASGEASER